ncbi:MAG: hypothetical protein ACLUFV_13185 [Acutalibacteraceae bacterium]
MKADYHVHYYIDGCAADEMTFPNIEKKALELGLDEISVLKHHSRRMPNGEAVWVCWKRVKPDEWQRYLDEYAAYRPEKLTIHSGVESELCGEDGEINISDEEAAKIDMVALSVHYMPDLDGLKMDFLLYPDLNFCPEQNNEEGRRELARWREKAAAFGAENAVKGLVNGYCNAIRAHKKVRTLSHMYDGLLPLRTYTFDVDALGEKRCIELFEPLFAVMRDNEVRWELTGGAVRFRHPAPRGRDGRASSPRPTRTSSTAAGVPSRTDEARRSSTVRLRRQGCRYNFGGEGRAVRQQACRAAAAPSMRGGQRRRADGRARSFCARVKRPRPVCRESRRSRRRDQRRRRAPRGGLPRGPARVGGVGKGSRFCAVAAQQRRRGVRRQAQRLPGGIDDALRALFAREADGCGVKAGVCAVGQRAAGGQQVAGAQQASSRPRMRSAAPAEAVRGRRRKLLRAVHLRLIRQSPSGSSSGHVQPSSASDAQEAAARAAAEDDAAARTAERAQEARDVRPCRPRARRRPRAGRG